MINASVLKRLDSALEPIASRLAGSFAEFSPSRHAIESAPEIALIRPGGMGDLILLQYAVESLSLDPKSFKWIVERRSSAWAAYAGLDYLEYDKPRNFVRLLRSSFHVVINTEQRFGLASSASIAAADSPRAVWAFDTNLGGRRLIPQTQRVSYDPFARHEVIEFRRLLASALGIDSHDLPIARRPRKSIPKSEVVAIGGTHAPSRSFGSEMWLRWIQEWRSEDSIQLLAAPSDWPLATSIVEGVEGATLVKGGFGEAMDTLSQASRVLTVDGGLVHAASYFAVPTDVIFTAGRSTKWAPTAETSRTKLRTDLPCQPCTLFGQVPPCPHDYACRDVDGLPWMAAVFP